MADNVILNGSLVISSTNSPTRQGLQVKTKSEIYSIQTPFVGMIVYVEDENAFYYITSLKAKTSIFGSIPDALVDEIKPFSINSGVYSYLGSVETYEELPTSANVGDVWNVVESFNNHPKGTDVAWTGTEWNALGGSFSLSESEEFIQLKDRVYNLELISGGSNLSVIKEDLDTLKLTVASHKVIDVAEDEKVIKLNNGKISTNLSLDYKDGVISLLSDEVVSSVDISDLKSTDGILNVTCENDQLTFTKVNNEEIIINAGKSITLTNNSISLVLNPNDNNLLLITNSGLLVDKSDVENIVDEKINYALDWIETL